MFNRLKASASRAKLRRANDDEDNEDDDKVDKMRRYGKSRIAISQPYDFQCLTKDMSTVKLVPIQSQSGQANKFMGSQSVQADRSETVISQPFNFRGTDNRSMSLAPVVPEIPPITAGSSAGSRIMTPRPEITAMYSDQRFPAGYKVPRLPDQYQESRILRSGSSLAFPMLPTQPPGVPMATVDDLERILDVLRGIMDRVQDIDDENMQRRAALLARLLDDQSGTKAFSSHRMSVVFQMAVDVLESEAGEALPGSPVEMRWEGAKPFFQEVQKAFKNIVRQRRQA